MKYAKNLNRKQAFQILLISVTLTWIFFPIIGPEAVFAVFLVWPIFEMVNKLLYRKEIPCPYCGFDATWYRRDVKKANELVKSFWATNYPDLVNPKTLDNPGGEIPQDIPQQSPNSEEAASQNIIN